MRSDDDFLNEVSRRAAILTEQRQKRRRAIAAAASSAACLGIIALLSWVLSGFTGQEQPVPDAGAAQASIFAGSSIGGYVLIGVVSFALGVVFALFFGRRGKK